MNMYTFYKIIRGNRSISFKNSSKQYTTNLVYDKVFGSFCINAKEHTYTIILCPTCVLRRHHCRALLQKLKSDRNALLPLMYAHEI